MSATRDTGIRTAPRSWAALTVALAIVTVVGLAVATRRVPYLSDSLFHLSLVEAFRGAVEALNPRLIPLRPFQHLYFYVLEEAGPPSAAVARIPLLAMHAVGVVLLFRLVLQLGRDPRAAFLAALLFCAFPTVKAVTWTGAIGWPGRLICVLAGLSAVARHLERPTRWSWLSPLVWMALGLAFHQSAVWLPGAYVLLAWRHRGFRLPDVPSVFRDCRRPALLLPLLLGVAYFLYVAFLRPERHHGLSPGGIGAAAARASMVFLPETLRTLAVSGLRGEGGAAGFVAGAVPPVGACVVLLLLLRSGSSAVRTLLISALVELALPVLMTGFSIRYAYVAAALLSAALALRLGTAPGAFLRPGRIAILLVAALWLHDHVTDVGEVRSAGRIANRTLAQLEAIAAEHQNARQIVLIDAPYTTGVEDDVYVLNYGIRKALAIRGTERSWLLVRRRKSWASSDFRRLDDDVLAKRIANPRVPVFRYDPRARSYSPASELPQQ